MQTRNEWAVVAELTATLSEAQQWWLFITLPLQCEEDSPTVEAFIVDVWRRPVTTETLNEFRQEFVEWVRRGYR